MLSLRVHTLMQGQLTAALEDKDWSASPQARQMAQVGQLPAKVSCLTLHYVKDVWLRLYGRFMCMTVMLLDANDHEAIEMNPMDLALPLIPKSQLSIVQPPSHLAEPE